MDHKKTVGENIRRLRKEHNFTQALLAKSIGISVATLSSYETGKTAPPMLVVCKMAEVFRTSVDGVLGVRKPQAEPTLDY